MEKRGTQRLQSAYPITCPEIAGARERLGYLYLGFGLSFSIICFTV